jgi:hypothetical protein
MNSDEFFKKIDPFELRQSIQHDLWMSHVMCTGVVYGDGVWPTSDMAPRSVSRARSSGTTKSHRLLWRDWWPSRCALRVHQSWQSRRCDSVAPVRLVRLALIWTGVWPFFLLSLLSFPPLSCRSNPVSPCRRPRRPASSGHHSSPNAIVLLPEGCSSIWTM